MRKKSKLVLEKIILALHKQNIKLKNEILSRIPIWVVKKPDGNKVLVTIMRNKSDDTYSFINLSKQHICSCRFESIEDAILDMQLRKEAGKIAKYYTIDDN